MNLNIQHRNKKFISPGLVAMTVIPVFWEAEVGGSQSEAHPSQNHETLPKKLTEAKRAGKVAQVLEHLLFES
jgi:hypothetical protein